MFLRELLFILPLVVAVTVGQTNGGYGYYGSSNVRYQRPQPIYGQRPLVLPGRPMLPPGPVTAAPVVPVVTDATVVPVVTDATVVPVVTAAPAAPAAPVPILDGPQAPTAPAAPAYAPVLPPRPIYSSAYRPLLPPRPVRPAPQAVVPPQLPTTTALPVLLVEAIQPEPAVEQPEPTQRPAPEPIQPSVEPEPILQPVYIPEPIVQPEPVAQPEPVPQPEPIAQPVPAPLAEPIVQPVPTPLPELIAEPVPAPLPEPIAQPLPAPLPRPIAQPLPALLPEPIVQPVPAPLPEPIAQPVPAPLPEPIAQPVPAPLPEPIAQPVPAPLPEPIAQPVPAPLPEPIAQPVPAPLPEPITEPVPSPLPEPIAQPVPAPLPEPIVQPMPAPLPEPIAQPVPAPLPEPIVEPVPSPLPELIAQPIPALLPEPIAQPVPAPLPEPIAQPVPEPIQEMSPAQVPAIVPQRDDASMSKPQLMPVNSRDFIVPQSDKLVAFPPLLPKREHIREPALGRHPLPPIEYPTVTQPTQTPSYSYPTPPRTVATQAPTVFTEQTIGPVVVVTRQPNPPVTQSPGQFQFDFQCKEGNGYYSVEHECDTYVECKQNKAMKYVCPDGLHFNPAAKHYEYPCAYPSEVKCVAGDQEQNPKPTDTCPNQYGFYSMNDGDCSKFIMCQEGLATIMNCPMGLAFNPQTSSCDWPANVPQCNPNVFKDFTCPDPPQDEDGQISDIIYKYRYGGQCKLYIACQLGHPRLLSCERGLSYDDDSQSCINEDYVTDCAVPYLQSEQ